ncbi:putative RNA-directed DNA polymerase, eukaryota, reverse transcriptase zinc-binding domain protein [Tanacetum coccineum]
MLCRPSHLILALELPSPPPPPTQSFPPPPSPSGKSSNTTIVVIAVVASIGLLVVVFVMVLRRRKRNIQVHPPENLVSENGDDVDEISTAESLQYSFGIIKEATDDFSDNNKLGQGGFGLVYKGKLKNGQEIAVKRLSRDSGQGDLEFKNEILQSVRLLIGKEARYKIIGGVARGLLYLHEDSRLKIIHRDLKASNVLLDAQMNAKIADFGMARLFTPDETQGNTSRIVGTYGYMAPEYAMHGQFSVKSDVFSFGVLVLEIVTGQKNNSFQNGMMMEDLLSHTDKSERSNINLVHVLCSLDNFHHWDGVVPAMGNGAVYRYRQPDRSETSLFTAADVNQKINLVKALADLEHRKLKDLNKKSKLKWDLEGDENSNFFHGIINNRRNRSRINGLAIDGSWMTDPTTIKSHIFQFFESKFKETNHTRPSFSSNLFKQLTSEDNIFLESPFTSQEIKDAVWDCGGNKAPGPDGFTFKLIKKHWSILGDDITSYVKDFYTSAFIPRGCNSSFITLVPKVDDPITVSDFRPISLIGCQYKIVAKVLANRLALVIPLVVSEVQMAFIKGRQIMDGPLLVNEIILWAKKHKKKLLLLKVDFEKALDSLSWSFLESIMLQMGFGAKWRTWMHSCLNSAYASILINGSPTNEFKMEKGLRQGDPLSPFLFILAVEALNVVFIEARNNSIFLGAEVGKDKVLISHLQFTGDALIVGQWSLPNARKLSRILTCFHLASEPQNNFNNSKNFGIGDSSSELNSIAFSECAPMPHLNGTSAFVSSPVHGANINVFGPGSLSPVSHLQPPGLMFSWSWTRQPRSVVENQELLELTNLLSSLCLSNDIDTWECSISNDRLFTVKSMRKYISSLHYASNPLTYKINISSWRIFLERLPTRANLDRRGIDLHSTRCPVCDNDIETEVHLFISCEVAKEVWHKVLKWWSIQNVTVTSLLDVITLA